jgi:hypothetical protein
MLPFKERERIKIKEGFSVTPYFVSHSAFDAYMFLIECEGKKILHTGDFRRHGYLGKGLFPTLEKYIGHVDLLITEGTMLGRKQEQVVTEKQIQLNTIRALCEHKYVFALCSSTDIDRLASFHAACKATGKVFLVDGYQRSVLDVFSEYSGKKSPLYNFNHIFELSGHKAYRIPKIKDYLRDKGFLMPVRMNSLWLLEDMLQVFNDKAPWLIYSMWSGYAEEGGKNAIESVLSIRKLFKNRILDGVEDGALDWFDVPVCLGAEAAIDEASPDAFTHLGVGVGAEGVLASRNEGVFAIGKTCLFHLIGESVLGSDSLRAPCFSLIHVAARADIVEIDTGVWFKR